MNNMETKIFDLSELDMRLLEEANVIGNEDNLTKLREAKAQITEAAEIIKNGGLVAFPTETVYGLGADAFNSKAVKRVYEVKGRPQDNPMIVHIARASDIGRLSPSLTPDIIKLIDAFWPGPLTLVLKKNEEVPSAVTGGLDTVAVRIPDDEIALALIRSAGTPIAAPSANISGKPSPTCGEHVVFDLGGRIDAVIMGAECRVGIESTVLDVSGETAVILRPGFIGVRDIEAVIDKEVRLHPSLLEDSPELLPDSAYAGNMRSKIPESPAGFADTPPKSPIGFVGAPLCDSGSGAGNGLVGAGMDFNSARRTADEPTEGVATPVGFAGTPPKSPGMKYKHYAPAAEMMVLEGERERVVREMNRLKLLNEGLGRKVGTVLFEEKAFVEAAHGLFAELRALDDEGIDLIIAGALSRNDSLGFAVMNRMMKAAGYNIIKI